MLIRDHGILRQKVFPFFSYEFVQFKFHPFLLGLSQSSFFVFQDALNYLLFLGQFEVLVAVFLFDATKLEVSFLGCISVIVLG